jgi:hypothetical protein
MLMGNVNRRFEVANLTKRSLIARPRRRQRSRLRPPNRSLRTVEERINSVVKKAAYLRTKTTFTPG